MILKKIKEKVLYITVISEPENLLEKFKLLNPKKSFKQI
tara:strand:- start:225 stop:341 length:117 start_codon:yes stop_codon:yes gene_type:complete